LFHGPKPGPETDRKLVPSTACRFQARNPFLDLNEAPKPVQMFAEGLSVSFFLLFE
jgi:hypothetical protein